MRGFVIGCGLLLGALVAFGQEPSALVTMFQGGFAPNGKEFSVTFRFSDMSVVPPDRKAAAPAMEWSSVAGATARLELCGVKVPFGLSDATLAVARLRLINATDRPFKTTLAVAIAPQGRIHALAFARQAFLVEGRLILISDTPSRGAILAESPFAARPLTPQDEAHVESVAGECRGEMLFDLVLMPGQKQTLGFICPVKLPPGNEPALDFYRGLAIEDLFAEAQKQSAAKTP